MPAFEGRVLRVAADASRDERTGFSWYEVEVAMGQAIRPEAEHAVAAWLDRLWDRIATWDADGPGRGTAGQGAIPERPRTAPLPGGGRQPELLSPAPAPGSDTVRTASVLALTPGMPAEVRLRTGDRSPLSYLFKPLSDYFSRSLCED